MMTDGRYRVSLPRRARIGVAAAEGLPACASGERQHRCGGRVAHGALESPVPHGLGGWQLGPEGHGLMDTTASVG